MGTDVDREAGPDPDLSSWAADVPEIMVLPEPQPGRDRPTVPLERVPVPVPGQPGRPRTPAAELEIKRSRMENSPFWLTEEERAAADNTWPPGIRDTSGSPSRAGERPGPAARPRTPHRTGRSLLGLIVLALVAAFFSWVSAEPFWLAVGHGRPGLATVARCTGSGVTQRCAGSFTASGDGSAKRVTLLGISAAARDPGTVVPARMVSPSSRQAYVGAAGTLLHLRWVLGFALVLLCGLGIAGLTGTRQLETARARRGALLVSVAGPLLLLGGFLLAAY